MSWTLAWCSAMLRIGSGWRVMASPDEDEATADVDGAGADQDEAML